MPDLDVAIIGAGPYGLSAAAHLAGKGLGVQVFGQPMEFWADKMPEGMLLRSPREASNLSDPRSRWTLDAYDKAVGAPAESPLPLSTFVSYGRWFQEQLGSVIQRSEVDALSTDNVGFVLKFAGGNTVRARRVVVAAGIGSFGRKPKPFAHLPREYASHCYEGRRIDELSKKRVAVIGAGQSALESAALLSEAGGSVEIIASIPKLRWIGQHPRLHRLGLISAALYSKHDIGPIGISRLVAMPKLLYRVPMSLRDKIRKRAVRSAGAKWLPPRVAPIKASLGRLTQEAKLVGGELQLKLDDGTERRVDHVLMGTGYDVDIRRYSFLSQELGTRIARLGGYPDLGAGFHCSVPGLHFIGATAARNFGPLLQFVAGAEFASNELTSYIMRHRRKGN